VFGNKSPVSFFAKTFQIPCPFIFTHKKQQLPTPHRHHSRLEMNSMPGRSRRHQPSSFLGLPQDHRIEIVACLGATSEQPLADLRSLHGTYSTMRCVCGHDDASRCLSIEGIRDEISWVWDPTTYKAFLAMLTGLGNTEACFFSGIKTVFIENRGYNDLRRAAEGGHDAAAYLYAILLYRDNGGADDDDSAKWYMRRVAGGGSTTSRWLSNEGCLPLCEKVARAIHYSTWRIWGEPLPHLAQVRGDQSCAGNGGGVEKGWLRISLFCSEDCRLPCEMVKFAQSIGIGNQ
jgi:hypothetical protein